MELPKEIQESSHAAHVDNGNLRENLHVTVNAPLSSTLAKSMICNKSSYVSPSRCLGNLWRGSIKSKDSASSLALLRMSANAVCTHSINSKNNINRPGVKPSLHYSEKSCYVQRRMQEIIPGIFCGSYHQAKDRDLLIENGITHVVCCVGGVDNPRLFQRDFHYLVIPAEDRDGYDILRHFGETFEFIDSALFGQRRVGVRDGSSQKVMKGEREILDCANDGEKRRYRMVVHDGIPACPSTEMTMYMKNRSADNLVVTEESEEPCYAEEGKLEIADDYLLSCDESQECHVSAVDMTPYIPNTKVLIHCGAGISRAPTVVCAYLIKKFQLTSAAPAIQVVQAARPCARPNPGFKKQLDKYASTENSKI
eukprot:Tbor_TRINITY_DN5817_c1_g2::TRINITY_DN5817_c1_g2_i1::g.6641::m.6641